MGTRIDREKRIITNMLLLYCKDHHNSLELCESCNDLKEYTFKRLISCPFEKNKPTCSKCTNHCYNKIEKKKIKEVMKYAGPKMLRKFPKDTILYYYYKIKYKNYTVK
jgi:YbgA-like uncharacterized protein